jgi:predicted nucleic acid-binding protein
MPYLFDTNIFLEILLDQDKKNKAKKILSDNIDQLYISDFSLHSIGVILLKQKKFKIFNAFLSDIIPHATILGLPKNSYSDLNIFSEKYSMDFDDSYQVIIANEYNLDVLTMDKDFQRVKDFINVEFL